MSHTTFNPKGPGVVRIREVMKYKTNGTYNYSSDPNVFVRVNVRRVSVPRSHSSHHGSCAHSSCACACASAGGGRAGCSSKDFYKGPSLEQIAKHKDTNL